MKTIEQAAVEYAIHREVDSTELQYIGKYQKSFKAGVEFAQRWIPIERDNEGLVKYSTMDEMESNVPFITRLTKDEEFLYDIWYEFGADLDLGQFYTHWRPIELK